MPPARRGIMQYLRWLAFVPFLVACGAGPTAPPEEPVGVTTTTSAIVANATETSKAAPRARVEVTSAEGVPLDTAQVMAERARKPLLECLSGTDQTLELRVTRENGVVHVDAERGASLDPRQRACAQAVLREVYLPPTASNVGFPDVPPSSFTSHLTIRW
jgi:hypothetical protein